MLFCSFSTATAQTVQYIKGGAAVAGSAVDGQTDLLIINFPVAGWYLVSLPFSVQDSAAATLFPMAQGGVFAYENGQYVNATTISVGRGYWIFVPQPSAAFITGTPITQFDGHFTPGWHLIGSVIDTVDFSDPDDTPDGSILLPIFRWNGATQRYFPSTTTVLQSFGHWMAVLQECDLTVDGSAPAVIAKSRVIDDAAIARFHRLYGTQPPAPPFSVFSDQGAVFSPGAFELAQNYPNPFNPTTVISYRLPMDSAVRLSIYATTGRVVRTLVQGQVIAGSHRVVWDGRDKHGQPVASGVYVYKLITGAGVQSRKMILLR